MATRQSDFWAERATPRIDPARLGEVLASAADLALVVSPQGRIQFVAINPDNTSLGHLDHWEGRPLRDFLAPDSIDKVARQVAAVAGGASNVATAIEVNHVDGAEWDAPVRYTVHATGDAGHVLLLGRDLRPLAELQQRLVRAQVALERDREAQRVHETRFRVLLDAASEGFALIDLGSGRFVEANEAAAAFLGASPDSLRGAPVAVEFEGRRRGELVDALCAAGQREDDRPVEVAAARGGARLRLHAKVFRGGGERALLVRITPADPGGAPSGDPRAARALALYERAPDAMAFADARGLVVGSNDAFLSLVDLDAAGDLRGRMLADFLGRGAVDMRVLTGDAGLRLHATHVVSAYGTRVPVEIAPVGLGPDGHAFVLREAERAAPLRAPDGDPSGEPAMAAGPALVGTAPLRDIVAKATDAIERDCIAAAIAYTDDNRVAAADMLGLSRQSLYVKLRKYGLLGRGED